MKIIACCIMAALQQCCCGQGGSGGFGGFTGAAAVGPQVMTAGTVFDPSGAPDPNVDLTVWRIGSYIARAKPDPDGKYSIWWQRWLAPVGERNAAQIRSTLIVRDQARNFVATRDVDETNTHLDLHMVEGLSLSGSVQDSGGKPMTGFNVRLMMPVNNWPSMLDQMLTDAQGSFNFKGLPQEGDYSVYVNIRTGSVDSGGYGSGRATLAAKDARTNHYTFPAFVLKKADRKVAGYVLDSDKKPLAGALLSLSGEGQPRLPGVKTDQWGHFALDGACEGPLEVFAFTIPPGGGVPRTVGTLNAVSGQAIRGGDTNLVLTSGGKPPEANAR